MRKEHYYKLLEIITETQEEVTIKLDKDCLYSLWLVNAGQGVTDALVKAGYKICVYDGKIQVLEELGAGLLNKGLKEIIEPCVFDVDVKKFKLVNSIKNELRYIYPESYLTEELESFSKHQLNYFWNTIKRNLSDEEKKQVTKTLFDSFKSELYKHKKYTIEDVREGKVGIEYKGDLDKLTKVLRGTFPKDDHDISENWKFYFKDQVYGDDWDMSDEKPDHIKIWVSENDIQL